LLSLLSLIIFSSQLESRWHVVLPRPPRLWLPRCTLIYFL
jgi:hypothetical protein